MEIYWIFLFIFFSLWMAQAQTRLLEAEEEEKNPDPGAAGDGWEYKMLGGPRNSFKDPKGQADSLAMESAAGWMMLEKLDDKQLRLKSGRVSGKNNDEAGQIGSQYLLFTVGVDAAQRCVSFLNRDEFAA